jgi:GNAT superfamily N-acetyltransferase
LLHPHYFNASHITGQELFWWIDPDHRGRGSELLNALEAWVKDQGAHSFVMITLEALEPERVGLIYRRRGYRPVEHSYLKEM